MIGSWKMYNEKLHNLYSSSSITRTTKARRIRWAGHLAHMGKSMSAYRMLVGKPEGKRPLGRRRRNGEDNITMDLREIGWHGMDWTDLDRHNVTQDCYSHCNLYSQHVSAIYGRVIVMLNCSLHCLSQF
jgi:hypothetical protein